MKIIFFCQVNKTIVVVLLMSIECIFSFSGYIHHVQNIQIAIQLMYIKNNKLITNFSAIIFAKYRLDLSSQIRLLPIFIFVSWNIKIKKNMKNSSWKWKHSYLLVTTNRTHYLLHNFTFITYYSSPMKE